MSFPLSVGFDNTSVRGRLAFSYQEWAKLGASGFILSVIREGSKIPFVSSPPPKVSANNSSALKHKEFVSQAISDLFSSSCVEPLHHRPGIVNPLSVSIQALGKKRLILDLSHVILCVFKRKFKCEDNGSNVFELQAFFLYFVCARSQAFPLK